VAGQHDGARLSVGLEACQRLLERHGGFELDRVGRRPLEAHERDPVRGFDVDHRVPKV